MRLSTLARLGAVTLLVCCTAATPALAQTYTASAIASPPAFDDISDGVGTLTGGTLVPGVFLTDPGLTVPLRFADITPWSTFTFYGVPRTSIRLASEGYLTFADQSAGTGTNETPTASLTPVTTSQTGQPNDLIAPFWDNLSNIATTPNTQVHRLYDAANNRLIFQYKNAHTTSTSTDLTFQVHLYQNGNIEFYYGTMTGANLASYSIGVQNTTGTSSTFPFSSSSTLTTGNVASGSAYLFTPTASATSTVCLATASIPIASAGPGQQFFWGITGTAGNSLANVANTAGYLVDIGTGAGLADLVDDFVTPYPYVPISLLPARSYYYTIRPFNNTGAPVTCGGFSTLSTTNANTVTTYPHVEAFSTGLPTGWAQDGADAGPGATPGTAGTGEQWLTGSSVPTYGPTGDHTTGTGGLAYVSDDVLLGANPRDNLQVNLISRPFNFTGITAPRVRFWMQNGNATSNSTDIPTLYVDVTTDGVNWTQAGAFPSLSTSWTQQTVSLPTAANAAGAFIRFRVAEVGAGIDNPVAIDDVVVDQTPTAAPNNAALTAPADVATGVVYGSPVFTWTAPIGGDPVDGYRLRVGTAANATDVVNDLDVGNVTSFMLRARLSPSTTYFWTVLPYNTVGTAAGATPFSFTTAAPTAVTAGTPFTETFTAVTVPTFPPANWTFFDNGIGLAQSWKLAGTAPSNAQSVFENVTDGTFAIDYLATPALALPASGGRLTFKMWQTSSGTSTYRVLVSTTSQGSVGSYTQVATWTSLQPCPGAAAIAIISPATPNCSVNLAAYGNQTVYVAFVHQTDFGFTMNIDDVTVVEGPTTPAFAITPLTTPFAYGTAGLCASPTSIAQTFTVSNDGGGSLQVSAAAHTGANASSFTVDASALPVTLGPGQSVLIPTSFAPLFNETGARTASLDVSYSLDGGATTLVSAKALTGTATAANAAVSNATTNTAGYAFRNAVAGTCTATSTATAPGTAFVPLTGHTRITTLDGTGTFDDGFFTLPVATLDNLISGGNIRFFGTTYESLFIGTNGYVTFGSGSTVFTPVLPTTAGGGMAAAAFTDFDTRPPFDTDNMGIGGAPGIYYGTADVDTDGDTELVVTWWHGYDAGTTAAVFPNVAARFATVQLIVHDAGVANREDRFEVRFPTGNDANGVPYRLNTDLNSFIDAGGAAVGLSNPLGTASSEYRDGSTGGPLYPSGTAGGVAFEAETQATATGGIGYRMMGSPLATGAGNVMTVGRLADLNLVQRVTGQYPTAPGPNLYTSYTGTIPAPPATNYVAAANVTDALAPGQGFFWRLYNQNIDSGTVPPANGAGTSDSYMLPMLLQATGAANTANVSRTLVPLSATNDGFSMHANPFRASLNISGVATWTGGAGLASTVLQTWDPNFNSGAGTYVLPMNLPTPNVFAAWQGFWVENNTSTSLVIPATAATTGGGFVGRPADSTAVVVAFRLDGTDAATGEPTVDLAAALAVSAEIASDGWDLFDASKLAPLASTYATVGFQGVGIDGSPRVKAQESRALDAASFDVPLVVDAVGTAPALTLSWAGLDALPETWALELRDVVTGQTVDLRQAASYTFDQTADPALDVPDDAILARTTTAAQDKAGTAPRFVLHVTTGRTTGTEAGAPTVFALAAPAPNPTASAATISFDVPEATTVTVAVYDLLGRRVAILAQGDVAAGRHTARVAAGSLAPGVYVVRMTAGGGGAGTFAATQRMTVVR